jgi:hypothetical protein
MPSTYTLNNGIELIATGEQSGTWGDTTNVNLGLIDTALDGQVTITLPAAGSSGSPNALAISDGSASNGRNRLVVFDDGGDLGATAFVQLTPNDAEKIVYIRNNLSGGRAITLFQGTYNASNDYEVPAGTTAVVFFDGGGSGAVAANVFNNAYFDSLRLGGVSVTAILDEDNMASDSATALATQQSIKAYVDAQVGANNELSEVLANGNTSGGNDIQMTTTDEVQFRDTALTISSSVDGQLDIAADVELEIVAPTVDINASTAVTIDTTTMTMTGSVNVVGDLDVDNLNINGNAIISTNTDGNIALTPNGTGEVDISKVDIDGGTIDGTVIGGSTPAAISGTTITGTSFVTTGDMTFGDNDKAIFGAGSDLQIYHDGSNSFIDEVGTGRLYIRASDGIYMSTPSNALYLSTFDTGGLALFHNGNAKLATTATGIDVTGTVTADGLTVDGTALLTTSTYFGINSNTPQIRMLDLDSNVSYTMLDASNGDFVIDVDANNATAGSSFDVKIDTKNTLTASSGGDISFYEDTGTTPKFFWDASAERLNLTGDDDFQFSIKQGANEAWFLRAVSDGRFSLHLNGTGDIVTATSTGLGIGTVSPAATLDVNGTIKLDGNYPVGTGNVALGDTAFQSVTSGADNTAIGAGSLRDTTTASFLTAVGKNSLVQNTTGSYSTALGNAALFGNTTGGYNTAVGHHALLSNTTASNNTAVGYNAGYSGTTASENVIIGTNAGYSITTGVNNTFVGGADPASAYGAGGAITTGSKNTIIGRYDGNQGGLDIRTSDNNIVLSDGDGNPRAYHDGTNWTVSGGIHIGGTGSANLLDDYEEGTWTPTVGGTSTYTVQAGSYTKIGRMVYLNFDMRINLLGTGSSQYISPASLPFAFASAGSARAAGSINWFNALAISRDAFYLEIDSNGIYLGSNNGASNTINEGAAFGNGAGIMASLWYTTTA